MLKLEWIRGTLITKSLFKFAFNLIGKNKEILNVLKFLQTFSLDYS